MPDISCDYCEKPIVGIVTNVGNSMEVILACASCIDKMKED